MLNLFKKNQAHFGLDISDISLKLMQLGKASQGFHVQAFSDAILPKDVISPEAIKEPEVLIKTVREAVEHPKFGKITTAYVVASIPETKSFVRVIQMPAMAEHELEEAIHWEAEQYIPMPLGQVYLDWLILNSPFPSLIKEGSRGEFSDSKMTVLITATPKDYVDDYLAILKAAGLKPIALEVESQATARSLISQNMEKEAVLIADINTIRTSLIIYDKGTLQFTSSIPVAGNIFTEAIAKSLEVKSEEAEKVKREVGLDEDEYQGKVKKALIPVINNIIEEIKNTIRFYEEHSSQDQKISRLVLSGGSSKLKHLPSFLHDKLTHGKDMEHPLRSLPGVKVELGNPWAKVLGVGKTAPISREDSLSYATAIGLALREME